MPESNRQLQIIKNKERIGNILFVIGLCLELLIMMTDHAADFTLPLRGRITQVAFVLFCLKICTTGYSLKQWICMLGLGALGALSYFTCADEYVIRCVVFIFAAREVDFKKLLPVIFYGSLAGTIVIVSLALLGISGKVVDIRHYGRGMEEARYCLGFNHANNVHDMLVYILSLWILIRREKIRWLELAVMTAINFGLYYFTVSRTGFLLVQLLIMVVLAVKIINNDKKSNYLVLTGNIGAFIITVYFTLLSAWKNIFMSNIVKYFDKILTGRLEMTFEKAGLRMWRMFPEPRTSPLVDNGFAMVAYSYGKVVFLLLLSFVLYLAIKCFIKNDIYCGAVLITAIFIVFMESTFIFNISLLCNMLLLLIGIVGFDTKKENIL